MYLTVGALYGGVQVLRDILDEAQLAEAEHPAQCRAHCEQSGGKAKLQEAKPSESASASTRG